MTEVIDNSDSVDRVLRKLEEFGAELSHEGVGVPSSMGRVMAVLAELRTSRQLGGTPEKTLETVQPTPPPFVLPPALQPRWNDWEQFFTALNQRFGWPNRDQYIYFAEIAATLSIRSVSGGGGGVGEAPSGLIQPWARNGQTGSWVQIEVDGGIY